MLGLLVIVLCVLLVPLCLFCLELFVGCAAFRQLTLQQLTLQQRSGGDTVKPVNTLGDLSAVVLVPAHNESEVIGATLQSLAKACGTNARVIVIADNCTDDTAQKARAMSFEVIERTHAHERGKGYALAYGLAYSQKYCPDVAIVVDADCDISQNAIDVLMASAHHHQTIVQGAYRLVAPEGASSKLKISEFAVFIKNIIRPLGLAKLGGSVPITGSGFAIPAVMFESISLASGEIVEDMKLGLDLVLMNQQVKFAFAAKIMSELPTQAIATQTQRARWEHGHIGMVLRYAPQLLVHAFKTLAAPKKQTAPQADQTKNIKPKPGVTALITALDLCILPFVLLLLVSSCLAVLLAVIAWLMGLPLIIVAIVGLKVCVMLGLLKANQLNESSRLVASDVAGVFSYVLAKVGLYKALAAGKRSGWQKTQRTKSDPHEASQKNNKDAQ